MNREELEKEAEKWVYEKNAVNCIRKQIPYFDFAQKAYIAGAEAHSTQWHDLEQDPTDLPKDYKTMCICLSDFGSKYEPVPRVCVGYYDSLGWSDYMGSALYSTVRYWCEIPKSEE